VRALLAVGLAVVAVAACSSGGSPSSGSGANGSAVVGRPPADGYFVQPAPVGAFASLPNDAQAAAMVHRTPWEPRPQNTPANRTVPPTDFRPQAYPGMVNGQQVYARIDGNFTGTTDEIIQWAAAKWGLPDNVIRAEAVAESGWFQNNKEPDGKPIDQQGYGDFGVNNGCGGSPTAAPYGPDGPASFGIMQAKWCTLNDPNEDGYGGWPWTENSTAYDLDTYAAVIRGCYEGWEPWLGNGYHAGDLWGCVGRWNSGAWYSPAAQSYIGRVQQALATKPWLTW
jgi:hypothetical protein